jgi:hypothetical protein
MVAQGLWGLVALRHGTGIAWLRGKLEGRRLRGEAKAVSDPELLEQVLRSNAEFLRAHNSDLYWRLYFLLSREAK